SQEAAQVRQAWSSAFEHDVALEAFIARLVVDAGGDREAGEVAAGIGETGAEGVDVFAQLGRGSVDRVPAGGPGDRAAQGGAAVAADPERRGWTLQRGGQADAGGGSEELPLGVDRVAGPAP